MPRCPFGRRHTFVKQVVQNASEAATIYRCERCGWWYARTLSEGQRAGRIMGVGVKRFSRPRGLPS